MQPAGLSPAIASIQLYPLPLVQGHTGEIEVSTLQPVTLAGSALDRDLQFFQKDATTQAALFGVHALVKPGPYPVRVRAVLPDGTQYDYEQLVLVDSGNYPQDPRLIVDPATVDPKVTQPELDEVAEITRPVTTQRYWSGAFLSPGYDPNWVTSYYGNRRTYNEDPTVLFHTGIDYGGGVGLPIHSPAAGVVVFAGPLTVRGNATIIDHGWGVLQRVLAPIRDPGKGGRPDRTRSADRAGGRHRTSNRRAPPLGGVGQRRPGGSVGLARARFSLTLSWCIISSRVINCTINNSEYVIMLSPADILQQSHAGEVFYGDRTIVLAF